MELLSSSPFNLPHSFQAVDDAIDRNADIAESILGVALKTYGIDATLPAEWHGAATPNDMDKARSTIRQMYRDWCREGETERKACYKPMIEALNRASSIVAPSQRCRMDVLIPGAGLGRLALEVCCAGYSVEGNEISYHQLMASNWALNNMPEAERFAMYPWALNFSNHVSRSHQLEKVLLPDVAPAKALDAASQKLDTEVHAFERMSMSSGDFCVLYQGQEYAEAFDAVLTCFFIDTAPNVIAYIETVKHCLKPGGAWINMGPLLWHFESNSNQAQTKDTGSDDPEKSASRGIGEAGSFELTDEEVMKLIQQFGFEITHHDATGNETDYIQNPASMLRSVYRPSFWVAKKTG